MTAEAPARRTIYLSQQERLRGGRLFIRFSGFNGLGISFLGDATVTLLAIHFGAGNTELGLISAMIHITGIVLLVIPRLFRGRNVVTVGFWSWMMRGLVCLPYLLLFRMDDRPAVKLILITYALFCISRTAGVSMVMTIQKRLMVSRTQNDLLFRNASSFQGNQILSRIVSYAVLSLRQLSELTGLMVLSALGLVFNTIAALTIRSIPNRTRVDWHPGENILAILKKTLSDGRSRRILTVRWISLSQAILFGMSVPLLRRSAGIDSARIFLYTIALGAAAFISSVSLRPIASRTGSRTLLFFAAVPGLLMFTTWAFLPATLPLAAWAAIGFVTIFVHNASNLAANRMLLDITPDHTAVGFNAMETFVTSVLALVLGFGAGFLADLSGVLSDRLPINDYGLVFLPAAFGSLVQVLLALRIEEPGGMGLMEAVRQIGDPANHRTWRMVSELETTADPVKRKTIIHSVGHSRASAATSEIGRILAEPLSQEQGDLIDALFLTRRPELTGYLCGEASDPNSFHRERAIFALGAYPGEETERVLAGLLDDPQPRIRAVAAKSLGRIGAEGHLEKIRTLWSSAENLQERLDLMIGLYHMDPDKLYLDDLFSPRLIAAGEKSERTLFTLMSRQYGMSPPLGVVYREELLHGGAGLDLLLEESRETKFLLDRTEQLEDLWKGRHFSAIWNLCLPPLAGINPPDELVPVVRALRKFPVRAAGIRIDASAGDAAQERSGHSQYADAANAMAALFFTYQILTSESRP